MVLLRRCPPHSTKVFPAHHWGVGLLWFEGRGDSEFRELSDTAPVPDLDCGAGDLQGVSLIRALFELVQEGGWNERTQDDHFLAVLGRICNVGLCASALLQCENAEMEA